LDDRLGLLPIIKRRWWALLLGALLAGGTAYALVTEAPPTYKGEVKVLVGSINGDADTLGASGELARTYSELALSRPVLRYAIEDSGAPTTVDELEDRVSASANDISRIVTIAVEDNEAPDAARLANSIAKRLRQLSNQDPGEDTGVLEAFAVQPEVEALPEGRQAALLAAAQRSLGESSAGRIHVVQRAEPRGDPVGLGVGIVVALAALAGLVTAGAIAVAREASAEAVNVETSLKELPGVNFLGAVDAPRALSGPQARALPAWTGRGGPAVERYRLLAAKLEFLGEQQPLRTLLVLDSSDGATSQVVAANLGTAIMQPDRDVLVVDANSAGAGLTGAPGQFNGSALIDLVADDNGHKLDDHLDRLLTRQGWGPRVLELGTWAALATVDTQRAGHVLERLESAADVLLICAPPLHRSPAGLMWARVADGTLLAVEDGRGSLEQARETLQSLSLVGAEVVGTVVARRRLLGGLIGGGKGMAIRRQARAGQPVEPPVVSR
jgi:capsular polysaccharide biosynthesis protein/Mrp family chromosome partitioning ATPase